jgi:MoxR-like ATPase
MTALWQSYRAEKLAGPPADSAAQWQRVIDAGRNPADYVLSDALVAAVRVSLMLGQPLLISGEPGTGKTQLAYAIAWDLGLPPPLRFDTKSTTKASDLFYTFDTLGRLRDVVLRQPRPIGDYIVLGPFGEAILRACPAAAELDWLPRKLLPPAGTPSLSVVLIDEVDKAPRDVPNDLLSEFERMRFRIPELGTQEVIADNTRPPVVILTSNSERNLPDAFLRRCVFFDIPFPTDSELEAIIVARLSGYVLRESRLLRDALRLFRALRNPQEMRKQPGTAELINWILALVEFGIPIAEPLRDHWVIVQQTLPVLVKNRDDQERAPRLLEAVRNLD